MEVTGTAERNVLGTIRVKLYQTRSDSVLEELLSGTDVPTCALPQLAHSIVMSCSSILCTSSIVLAHAPKYSPHYP